jgi:FkbM family methyltransferase
MKMILNSISYRTKYDFRSIARTMSVWRQSRNIKHLLTKEKKGLFIDCGANVGQGFSYFSGFYTPDKFDYIVIEPNPYCQRTLHQVILERVPESQVQLIQKAASTSDGICKFYGLAPMEGGKTSEGASIVAEHNSKYYKSNENDAIEVATFSLSELIHRCHEIYDFIILKLDVEGAEYIIMPHLISTGAAQKIKHMYIEFHSQDVEIELQPERQRVERQIISNLSKLEVGFTRWI